MNSREERGKAIAELPDQIQRMSSVSYRVKSQSGDGFYDVKHGGTLDGVANALITFTEP